MKQIKMAAVVLLLLAGCTGAPVDKKARLDQLRKEHDKLTEEIQLLEKELAPADAGKSVTVAVEALTRKPFEHFIEVQGKIDGDENIAVSPRNQGGMVTRILVREGQPVTRGQVLAELDSEVLNQQVKDLRNKLEFATDLFNRQKALWEQKIGSEIQYLKAKNDKESLENGIRLVEEQIRMSVITAPISGTVEDIPIKVGQMASPSSPIPAFRIINFTKAKAVADVGEAYSSKVQAGDPVRIYLPDMDKELTEKITFASKFINPTNRTFLVECSISSPGVALRANMIAVLRIKDYANPEAIAIPQNFIQTSRDEGQFVFVAEEENGRKVARKRPVTASVSYGGLTEITSGLKEGDAIITAGYKDLYNGQPIEY